MLRPGAAMRSLWLVYAALMIAGVASLGLALLHVPEPPGLFQSLATVAAVTNLFAAHCFGVRYLVSRAPYAAFLCAACAAHGGGWLAELGLMFYSHAADLASLAPRPLPQPLYWLSAGQHPVFHFLLLCAVLRQPGVIRPARKVPWTDRLIGGSLALSVASVVVLLVSLGAFGWFAPMAHLLNIDRHLPPGMGWRWFPWLDPLLALLTVGIAFVRAQRHGQTAAWFAVIALAAWWQAACGIVVVWLPLSARYLDCLWASALALLMCGVLFWRLTTVARFSRLPQSIVHTLGTYGPIRHTWRSGRRFGGARAAHSVVEPEGGVDSLTGLWTRRRLLDRVAAEILLPHGADQVSSALLWIDVDDLAGWNRKRGHLFGDTLLATVGAAIGASARLSRYYAPDAAARSGGSFLLYLRGADSAGADLVAQRIRTAVAQQTGLLPVAAPLSASLAGHTWSTQGIATMFGLRKTPPDAVSSAAPPAGPAVTVTIAHITWTSARFVEAADLLHTLEKRLAEAKLARKR